MGVLAVYHMYQQKIPDVLDINLDIKFAGSTVNTLFGRHLGSLTNSNR